MPTSSELRERDLAAFRKKLRAAEDAALAERRRRRELGEALSTAKTVRDEALPRSLQGGGA